MPRDDRRDPTIPSGSGPRPRRGAAETVPGRADDTPRRSGGRAATTLSDHLRDHLNVGDKRPPVIPDVGTNFGPEGRYTLVAKLGAGGFGTVWKAVDHRTSEFAGRRLYVAIKTVNLDRVPPDEREGFLDAFKREGIDIKEFSSENIVKVTDYDEERGQPYIVMELVEGGTLKDVLKRRETLSSKEVFELGIQIARGLDYVHRRKFIHRDVKPGNIFLPGTGEYKVGDFGIVKRWRPDRGQTRSVMKGAGTPDYMSPEQWAAPSDLDPRSDVFSLCVVLYQALTGDLPFKTLPSFHEDFDPEASEHSSRRAWKIVHQAFSQVTPIRKLAKDVPRPLSDVVEKGLQVQRDKRQRDCAELARELDDARKGSGGIGRRTRAALLFGAALMTLGTALAIPPVRKAIRDTPSLVGAAVDRVGNWISPGQGTTPTAIPAVTTRTATPTATPLLPTPTPDVAQAMHVAEEAKHRADAARLLVPAAAGTDRKPADDAYNDGDKKSRGARSAADALAAAQYFDTATQLYEDLIPAGAVILPTPTKVGTPPTVTRTVRGATPTQSTTPTVAASHTTTPGKTPSEKPTPSATGSATQTVAPSATRTASATQPTHTATATKPTPSATPSHRPSPTTPPPNQPPTIGKKLTMDPAPRQDQVSTLSAPVSDPEGESVSCEWAVDGAPIPSGPGCTARWRPTESGTHTITLRARDARGQESTQTWPGAAVTPSGVPPPPPPPPPHSPSPDCNASADQLAKAWLDQQCAMAVAKYKESGVTATCSWTDLTSKAGAAPPTFSFTYKRVDVVAGSEKDGTCQATLNCPDCKCSAQSKECKW